MRAIGNQSRVIRLPMHVHEDILKVRRTRLALQGSLNRPPTELEVAEAVNLPLEKLRRLDTDMNTGSPLSLSASIYCSQKEGGNAKTLENVLYDPTPLPSVAVEGSALRDDLEHLIARTLNEREAFVLRLRYGLGDGRKRTLDEIGRGMCVTRERVRQIELRAMRKLREPEASGMLRDYLYDA